MSYTEQKLIAAVVSDGLRPVLVGSESGAPLRLVSLIKQCWDDDAENRPSFPDIISEIVTICDEVKFMEDNNHKVVQHTALPQQFIEQSSNSPFYTESINWSSQGADISNQISHVVASDTTKSLTHQYDISSYNPVLSWGSFAACGQRETMEDTHFLMPWIWGQKDFCLFGVFDGHRGELFVV